MAFRIGATPPARNTAVWTGIGAAGTFVLGIFLYGDPVGALRIFAVLLIIAGVVLLILAH